MIRPIKHNILIQLQITVQESMNRLGTIHNVGYSRFILV